MVGNGRDNVRIRTGKKSFTKKMLLEVQLLNYELGS